MAMSRVVANKSNILNYLLLALGFLCQIIVIMFMSLVLLMTRCWLLPKMMWRYSLKVGLF
ncbi:hypothetical protein [Moraxella lacunata]|uniref:hypothetical protein n=1 Tax=Moraxella lacunata TaxID=477 RepID=UPI003EE080E3